MSALDSALAVAASPCNGGVSELRDRRNMLKNGMDALLTDATARSSKALLASEQRQFDKAHEQIVAMDNRIKELDEQQIRQGAADASRLLAGQTANTGRYYVTGGGETYTRGDNSVSFFKDLRNAQRGDWDAAQRLQRNNQETRALGNTGGAGGSGGEFAPPGWLVDDYIRLARPGRVTADLFHKQTLPPNVSTINIPKVATGTTTAIQTTQNTALSQTDLTSTSLSAAVVTIGGKQVIAQQLLDQSAIPFDQMILEDLAADYSKQIGVQVLTGTGASGQLRGYLTPSSTNVQTWTQASPTIAGFYGQLAKLQSAINATRFMPPDTVVMHPRRWAWFASGTDTAGRPLVVPNSQGSFNTMAQSSDSLAAGHVGNVLGMDVYTDPNIATNTGAGTNQDTVLMFKRDDLWLYESQFRADVLTQPYGDSLGVLVRLWNYSALIPDRYLASLGQIVGTGLVTPTFAS